MSWCPQQPSALCLTKFLAKAAPGALLMNVIWRKHDSYYRSERLPLGGVIPTNRLQSIHHVCYTGRAAAAAAAAAGIARLIRYACRPARKQTQKSPFDDGRYRVRPVRARARNRRSQKAAARAPAGHWKVRGSNLSMGRQAAPGGGPFQVPPAWERGRIALKPKLGLGPVSSFRCS